MDINEYVKGLQTHDWFFDFCDAYDSPRWKNGFDRRHELLRAAEIHDPDFKIWNQHAPQMYQRKER